MVSEKLDQGYTFIAYSVDFIFLGQAARDGLTAIRSVLEGAAE
jgi:hypothetical protein